MLCTGLRSVCCRPWSCRSASARDSVECRVCCAISLSFRIPTCSPSCTVNCSGKGAKGAKCLGAHRITELCLNNRKKSCTHQLKAHRRDCRMLHGAVHALSLVCAPAIFPLAQEYLRQLYCARSLHNKQQTSCVRNSQIKCHQVIP